MNIPQKQRCSTDNIGNIQQQLEDLRHRYQNLQSKKENMNQTLNTVLECLENRVDKLPH